MSIVNVRPMFIFSAFVLFALLFSSNTSAAENSQEVFSDKLFLEIWNDNSYRKTNFGTDEPDYKEEDFYLSQLSLSTGVRFDVVEDVYFDTRLIFDLAGDWGSEEWNDVYWNNMMTWGVGARLGYDITPESKESKFVWISDLNLEMFAELLFSENTLDGGNENIPDEDSSNNVRTGISTWTSLDSREFFSGTMSLWAEIGAAFAYESTGFSEENMDNYYLFTLNPLFGVQFPLGTIFLQPYYKVDVIRDFGDEQWNKEPWLNNVTYGPGIRFSMGNLLPFEEADLYLYVEYMEVDYFSRVDSGQYEYSADDDFHAGIEIFIPFGATKDRIKRH